MFRKVAKVVGLDVFDPNYQINYRTIFVGTITSSLIVSYFVMLFQKPTVMFIFEGLVVCFLAGQVSINIKFEFYCVFVI